MYLLIGAVRIVSKRRKQGPWKIEEHYSRVCECLVSFAINFNDFRSEYWILAVHVEPAPIVRTWSRAWAPIDEARKLAPFGVVFSALVDVMISLGHFSEMSSGKSDEFGVRRNIKTPTAI